MGFVKSIFSRPKAPKVEQTVVQAGGVPQAPTIDQASQIAEDQNRLRRRRGRASYVKTNQQSLGQPTVGTKTLTGS